jgi:heme/copper-type cytochrome/quinol oxidase subunit 2
MVKRVSTIGWVAAVFIAGWLQASWAEPPQELTLTAMVEQGTKIWSPASLTIPKGHPVKLTLKNTTDAEHGFSIDELKIKEVIPAGGSKEITLQADSAGTLKYYCHLHKAHVGGQLLVQ